MSESQASGTQSVPATEESAWETVHRVVFPFDTDPSVLRLYVTWGSALTNATVRPISGRDFGTDPVSTDGASAKGDFARGDSAIQLDSERLTGHTRRSTRLPIDKRVSFATFFNAFPAAYWRQWTNVDQVRLNIQTEGDVDVDVFRSTARGSFNRIDSLEGVSGQHSIDIPLKNFGDGGWLWFEVVGHSSTSKLIQADWQVDPSARRHAEPTKFSAAITTFNRPDDCVVQMQRFAHDESLLERLDQLIITDQGTQRVSDADGFAEAREALGSSFTLVTQGNLGGSGGFARGMYEGSRREDTQYVILLDDDILIEPESILRSVNFADYTRKPVLVGGHMLNLYEKSKVQNFGEYVQEYPFRYGPVNTSLVDFDFARNDLRTTPELHKRIDVGYNGWWMCLIPVDVIKELGLSLPVFIKWDDVEYGVRAAKRGFPTVTLPGAGVWHMPFTEKDDRLDWQAYFHQRNRWLAALVYSPYKRGGALPRESFAADVKYLYSQQYASVALRLVALEDLLSGPEHLHRLIGTRTQDVRELRKKFSDGRVITDVAEYPEVKRDRPLPKGRVPEAPRNRVQWVVKAASAMARNLLKPTDAAAREHPEARIGALDANWWNVGGFDSSLVSTSDGTGASWYVRDRETFRTLIRRSQVLHRELTRNWDRLAREYQDAFPQFTSVEAWEETFRKNRGE